MSCYGCGTSFGTFKKEKGCKNCGFSFCSKCLTNKTKIPKLNNESHRVCMKCFNILTGKVKQTEEEVKFEPPANFVKRVEALKEREAAGQPSVSHTGGPSTSRSSGHNKAKYKGMSKADIDIAERLEKLREKSKEEAAASKVSNNEIGERLANLKGMNPSVYTEATKPKHHPPDRRTQQEQLEDLLQEISEEVDLESKLPDAAQEIAARLARLKGQGSAGTAAAGVEGSTDQAAADSNDENNLNKASVRDSQTFSQNISDTNEGGGTPVTKSLKSDTSKPRNVAGGEEGEITPEEMNKILSEAAEELERDAKKAMRDLEQDKEIMKRLKEVKQRRKESSTDVNKDEKDSERRSDSENEEGDEAEADAIIKRFVEESKLDEAAAQDGIDTEAGPSGARQKQKKKKKEEEWEDEDELPYCCICTEDATVRCYDCDRDLYCNTCFKEGHRDLGLDDHRSAKYIPPKAVT